MTERKPSRGAKAPPGDAPAAVPAADEDPFASFATDADADADADPFAAFGETESPPEDGDEQRPFFGGGAADELPVFSEDGADAPAGVLDDFAPAAAASSSNRDPPRV